MFQNIRNLVKIFHWILVEKTQSLAIQMPKKDEAFQNENTYLKKFNPKESQ